MVAFEVMKLFEQMAVECGPRRLLERGRRRLDVGISGAKVKARYGRKRKRPLRWVLRSAAGRVFGLRCRPGEAARWRTLLDFVRWVAARLEPVEVGLLDMECWCGSGLKAGSCCGVLYRPRCEFRRADWREVYRVTGMMEMLEAVEGVSAGGGAAWVACGG